MTEIHIGWPEGIWIATIVFALLASAILDGEPKTGTHKFSITLCSAILDAALLYWGGFFS